MQRPRGEQHSSSRRVAGPLTSAMLVWVLLAAGCGYAFPGADLPLPAGATAIRVGTFQNRTNEPGLESAARQAFTEELARRGKLAHGGDPTASVLVLEGTLRQLDTRPIAFTSTDQAAQYLTILVMDARLLAPGTDKIVWQVSGMRQDDSFGATSTTVVTQSPTFQQQTLNASDLANLPDVQLSEGQRKEAIERVLENASRDLFNSIVEDF